VPQPALVVHAIGQTHLKTVFPGGIVCSGDGTRRVPITLSHIPFFGNSKAFNTDGEHSPRARSRSALPSKVDLSLRERHSRLAERADYIELNHAILHARNRAKRNLSGT
jgi:hypothetical protein